MAKTLKERMRERYDGRVTVHWMAPQEGETVIDPLLDFERPACKVACNPALVFDRWNAGSGEAHAVTCPECMKHPLFAAKYEPHPRLTKYTDIPEEHRKVLEEYEAREGITAMLEKRPKT